MSTFPFARFIRITLLIAVVLSLLVFAPGASAKIRTGGGGDLPAYARISYDDIFHTDDWAVIVFYRPPECVPDDFNFLVFYDFPNELDPGAFGCTPNTTDGFIVWDSEPGLSDPYRIKLRGLGAVPVWFVSWPELKAEIDDDGIVTITDLEDMNSLRKGSAAFYSETLHPTTDAVQVPMINFVARGALDDGQPFKVQVIWVTISVLNVQIRFHK